MLSLIFASLYVIYYYNNESPPVYDIISPLVTLSIGLSAIIKYDHTIIVYLLCLSLIFEVTADLLIHNSSLQKCLILFSCGHIIRQIVVLVLLTLLTPRYEYLVISIICYIASMIALLAIILGIEEHKRLIIGCYTIIVAHTFFMVSFLQGTIDVGYICYVISDLIIGYEMLYYQINPRRLRILGVPILYWSGQYFITTRLLQ